PHLRFATASLHFSCSHTPWVSVVAISKARPVGVDVESTALAFGDPALLEAYFGEGERKDLDRIPPHARGAARARLWTLKEATVKMLGTGLALDISKLEFETERDGLRAVHIAEAASFGMRFASWFIASRAQRLSIAVALRR